MIIGIYTIGKGDEREKQKSIVLVDGSNFYFKLKDLNLHNLLEFYFGGFAKILVGDNGSTFSENLGFSS